MVGKCLSTTIIGIDARIIQIEVDLIPSQLPGFIIVGLPDKAVQEAKERIISAIKNSGFEWPRKKVVVNLAPADLPKVGTSFDLPIAIAILASTGQVEFNFKSYLFTGELSLEGDVRPVNGGLSIALEAKNNQIGTLILPKDNEVEAGLVEDVNVIGVEALKDVVAFLRNEREIMPVSTDWKSVLNNPGYI